MQEYPHTRFRGWFINDEDLLSGFMSKGKRNIDYIFYKDVIHPDLMEKIVETALGANASAVVLAHNHPSGVAIPSGEDIQTTRRIAMALQAVDVQLVDHLVVADADYVSMVQSGIRIEDIMLV